MTFRPALALGTALLAFAAIQMGAAAAAESIDLYGVTEATLAWAPATGPVVGYYVIVTRSSETAAVQSLAFEPRTTISAAIGDEVTVAVSAFDIGDSQDRSRKLRPRCASTRRAAPPPRTTRPPTTRPRTTRRRILRAGKVRPPSTSTGTESRICSCARAVVATRSRSGA